MTKYWYSSIVTNTSMILACTGWVLGGRAKDSEKNI